MSNVFAVFCLIVSLGFLALGWKAWNQAWDEQS